jgi:hypothetical protein
VQHLAMPAILAPLPTTSHTHTPPPCHRQVTAFQSVPRSSQLSTELSADLDGLESNLREALRVSAAGGGNTGHMRTCMLGSKHAARLAPLLATALQPLPATEHGNEPVCRGSPC